MDQDTAIFTVFIIALLGGVLLISNAVAKTSCKAKAVSFEAHSYGPIQGCLVKHKGRWLPLENIRGFD